MLRQVDTAACANRWRAHSEAVAVFCGGLMLCALLAPPLRAAPAVAGVALLAALAGARVPARDYLRALLMPVAFLATSAAALCVSISWSHGPHFAYSPVGAHTALEAGARAFAAICVTMLFAFTVPFTQWLALLRRLRTPEPLLDLILVTYRTIFLLDDGLASIVRAQTGRLGYRDARRAHRSVALAAGALFLRSLDQARRLERGLAARNYTGRLTVLLPPSATRARHLALALAVPALVAAAAFLPLP
jgi:cobalt/nickel transport system permease protein